MRPKMEAASSTNMAVAVADILGAAARPIEIVKASAWGMHNSMTGCVCVRAVCTRMSKKREDLKMCVCVYCL